MVHLFGSTIIIAEISAEVLPLELGLTAPHKNKKSENESRAEKEIMDLLKKIIRSVPHRIGSKLLDLGPELNDISRAVESELDASLASPESGVDKKKLNDALEAPFKRVFESLDRSSRSKTRRSARSKTRSLTSF